MMFTIYSEGLTDRKIWLRMTKIYPGGIPGITGGVAGIMGGTPGIIGGIPEASKKNCTYIKTHDLATSLCALGE